MIKDTELKPLHLVQDIQNKSHVLLSISMEQLDQTGNDFLSMINCLIADKRILWITLLLTDTLNATNKKLQNPNLSMEEATKLAIEVGEQFKKENEATIELLKKSGKLVKILYWDDCKKFEKNGIEKINDTLIKNKLEIDINNLDDATKIIDEFYKKNTPFKNAVDSLAKKIVKDKFNAKETKYKDTLNDVITYILEENAVRLLMIHTQSFDYELYRHKFPNSMQLVQKQFGIPGRLSQVHFSDSTKKLNKTKQELLSGLFFNQSELQKLSRMSTPIYDPNAALCLAMLNQTVHLFTEEKISAEDWKKIVIPFLEFSFQINKTLGKSTFNDNKENIFTMFNQQELPNDDNYQKNDHTIN